MYAGDVSLTKMRLGAGKTVKKIISHKGFNAYTNDNDIALLELNTPLTFTSEFPPEFSIFSAERSGLLQVNHFP